ncbi:MAG: DMT family transporter [Solirubrobacterales bacterium]|nr:DMT family transporter [Solirubrobacterales bacterium]
MISVLLGAAAALCWGVQNVLLAGVARKGDPGVASFWYVGYMALLALPFAVATWDPSELEGGAAGYLVLAGVVQGLGMLFFTRALAIGPIGMLTGLLSLEGAGAAILSFVAGEAIGGPVAAGLVLCSAGGVLLVAARADDVPGRSVGLTMFAVACNAAGLFSLGYYEVNLALTMVIFNGASAAVIAGLLKVQGGSPPLTEGHFESRGSEAMPILISALGLLGLVAFTYGSREGSTAVTAVLSAQFAGVAAIGGYLHFSEKMEPRQILGFGILVCGVSLVAAFA